jgi:hypothetical protein
MDWTPEDDLTDDTRLRGLGLSRLEEERVVFRLDLDCRTCRSRRARGVIAPVLPIAVRCRVLLALHAATIRRDKGDVLVCYLKDLAVNPPMQKMAGRLEDYAAPRLRITMALLL